jgi:hypothetical protein
MLRRAIKRRAVLRSLRLAGGVLVCMLRANPGKSVATSGCQAVFVREQALRDATRARMHVRAEFLDVSPARFAQWRLGRTRGCLLRARRAEVCHAAWCQQHTDDETREERFHERNLHPGMELVNTVGSFPDNVAGAILT